MKRLKIFALALMLSPAAALAQQAQQAQQDVMIPSQSAALTWIIGIGILILTLIAGFKHPGRTHLD